MTHRRTIAASLPVAAAICAMVTAVPDRSSVARLRFTHCCIASLHRFGTVTRMDSEDTAKPLRVPISAAAERGVSWLNEQAEDRRIILTKFGRPGAVVDSAERLDETARVVREARREVVASMCDVAAERAGTRRGLAEVCEALGLDPERVRARARELAE